MSVTTSQIVTDTAFPGEPNRKEKLDVVTAVTGLVTFRPSGTRAPGEAKTGGKKCDCKSSSYRVESMSFREVYKSLPTRELQKEYKKQFMGKKKKRFRAKRKSPESVQLPRYMTPESLSKNLKTTLGKLSKAGGKTFDWWPNTTHKTLRKTAYRDVKDIVLSFEEASSMCDHFDCKPELKTVVTDPDQLDEGVDQGEPRVKAPRPSIVSILGHVDHGKTTLLDTLRGANIAKKEVGGITQETYCFNLILGDSQTETPKPGQPHKQQAGDPKPKSSTLEASQPQQPSQSSSSSPLQAHPPSQIPSQPLDITFLDTPGHHIFVNMRDNAAFISDLAIIVVDCDEGIQPQTWESIAFATQHHIPIMPVISKLDHGVDVDIKTASKVNALAKELTTAIENTGKSFEYPQKHLSPEMIKPLPISAKTGWNMHSFRTEISERLCGLEPMTTLSSSAYGAVIEAFREDSGRGDIVTLVLWKGILKLGDYFATGSTWGRVKQIQSTGDKKLLDEVTPGIPVQIMGLNTLPEPGDDFIGLSEDDAKFVAEERMCELAYEAQHRLESNGDFDGGDGIRGAYEDAWDETKTKAKATAEGEWEETYPDQEDQNLHVYDRASDPNYAPGSKKKPHRVIVKADSQGTLKPLVTTCQEPLKDPETGKETYIEVMHASVGAIKKRDVLLADAGGASIQCFKTRPPAKPTQELIKRMNVEVNHFDVYFDFLRNVGVSLR
ncbi:hypothetical protein AAMO2058_000409600 [Amorphochlora amoebiformis]